MLKVAMLASSLRLPCPLSILACLCDAQSIS
jgi:hypothetical protein